MCSVRRLHVTKDSAHSVQRYRFSAAWTLIWCFKLADDEYDLGHSEHLYGFSPVWILICSFRWSDVGNALSHSEHTKGLSVVWSLITCLFRLLDAENDFEHSEQLCVFFTRRSFLALILKQNQMLLWHIVGYFFTSVSTKLTGRHIRKWVYKYIGMTLYCSTL